MNFVLNNFNNERYHLNLLTGNRCCLPHLLMKRNRFYDDDLRLLRVHSRYSIIEGSEVTKLFETLSARVDQELIDKIPENMLDEKRLKVFTGLTWEQLNHVRSMMTTMRNSDVRDVTQALVVFLFKLRTGNSNILIASILGLFKQKHLNLLKSFHELGSFGYGS